jgi:hypothetical protein
MWMSSCCKSIKYSQSSNPKNQISAITPISQNGEALLNTFKEKLTCEKSVIKTFPSAYRPSEQTKYNRTAAFPCLLKTGCKPFGTIDG